MNDKYRGGYHGFLSLIVLLFRMNRAFKAMRSEARIEIKLPVKWL